MRLACLALLLLAQDTDPVAKFADSLRPGDDPLVKSFQEALRTKAGRLALSDRTAKTADELRRRAEKNALQDWFLGRFEEVDGRYRLRAGHEDWRGETLEGFARHQAEVARLEPYLKEIAAKLVDAPEVNARLKAYLGHPAAAHAFYHRDLRPKTAPDVYELQKRVGQFLAADADGKLIVPEGRRELATAAKTLADALVKTAAETVKPFGAFCAKLTVDDELHARIKAASQDPLFLGLILKKAAGEFKPENADEIALKIRDAAGTLMDRVEDGVEDGRIKDDAREKLREILDGYDARRKKAAALREPARRLARMIKAEDPLAKELGELLQSDIVLALLGEEIETAGVDALALVKSRVGEVLVPTPEGGLRIDPSREAEVGGEIKDPAQAFGGEEKALRLVSAHGARIEDAGLRAAFTSPFGRYVVEEEAKARLAAASYDGLGAWIAKHFEDGALRPGSRGEIEDVLARAKALEARAADDDLK